MVYYNLKRYNNNMFLVGLASWWYSGGLKRQFKLLISRAESALDFFSIQSLASTWVDPYKQISAEYNKTVSLPEQLRAMLDQLISRAIGTVIRTFMIIFGLLLIGLQFLFGLLIIIFWLVLPFAPIVFLFLAFSGVNLSWII